MNSLHRAVRYFVVEETGAAMVEYGLLGALIAVVCVAAINVLGISLNDIFTVIGTCLTTGVCS